MDIPDLNPVLAKNRAQISRPELAKIIGNALASLRLPDGRKMRLMAHSQFAGHGPRIQKGIEDRAELIGVAILHEISLAGYTLTHANDAKTEETPTRKVLGVCAHCGQKLVRLQVDDKMQAVLTRTVQETYNIPHSDGKLGCPASRT
jgi:hypothetical protein